MTRTPKLSGYVQVRDDVMDLYEDLGRALAGAAEQAISDRGTCHLALSGGSTPERFYMTLVTEPMFRSLPWDQIHLWLVDERQVPLDDDRSNFRMIRESLVDHVTVPQKQKHPIPTHEPDPAAAYEHELREAFGDVGEWSGQIPRMDFVLLGMGEDCHTASLFPHSPALREHDCLVCPNKGPRVTPPPRVTMTFSMLNAARELAVLVTGEDKAQAIRRVEAQLRECPDPVNLPITGIDPIDGEVTWYLDTAAAGEA
ncbi:MAG: 6-phosphogluconolactonase [Phycisphaeraceae bacterium]